MNIFLGVEICTYKLLHSACKCYCLRRRLLSREQLKHCWQSQKPSELFKASRWGGQKFWNTQIFKVYHSNSYRTGSNQNSGIHSMYYNIYVCITAQMIHTIFIHFPIVVEIEESFLAYLKSFDSAKRSKAVLKFFS